MSELHILETTRSGRLPAAGAGGGNCAGLWQGLLVGAMPFASCWSRFPRAPASAGNAPHCRRLDSAP